MIAVTDPSVILYGAAGLLTAFSGFYALLLRRRREDRDVMFEELDYVTEELRRCRHGERVAATWANELAGVLLQHGIRVPDPPVPPPEINGEFDERRRRRRRP